jgi:hypothetical protein
VSLALAIFSAVIVRSRGKISDKIIKEIRERQTASNTRTK